MELPLFWDIGALFSGEREDALDLRSFYSLQRSFTTKGYPFDSFVSSVAQGRLKAHEEDPKIVTTEDNESHLPSGSQAIGALKPGIPYPE